VAALAVVLLTALAPAGLSASAARSAAAAPGARLWVARYNGPENTGSKATAVAVSPTGQTVFVTGSSRKGTGTGSAYLTVAYNATTGAQLWETAYGGQSGFDDIATSTTAGPAGTL
jgi:hypothetical protein